MITVNQRLVQSMTVIDVYDPDEMAADSTVSRRFPASNNKHRYTLRNRPRDIGRPHGLLTRFAMRHAGDLMLGYAADRFGTEIEIVDGAKDRFCLSMILAGRMEISTRARRSDHTSSQTGLIYRGDAGTRLLTGDDTARMNIWIAAERVERMLRALIDGPLNEKLEFDVAIDWGAAPASSLQGLVGYLCAEMEAEERLLASPVALETFTDLFVQGMLRCVPHNYSGRLGRDRPFPAPRAVRRAEEYLRAHAAERVRMDAVARAAGCSLRTLQLAFRRFRETTPHGFLQRVRLDAARRDLLQRDDAVGAIARRWGFSSPGRFSAAYAQTFGERPSDTVGRSIDTAEPGARVWRRPGRDDNT